MGSSKASRWQSITISASPGFVLSLFVLIALSLYHETVFGLAELWTLPEDTTYHHGFALVAICAFLFWRRWAAAGQSRQLQPSVSAAVLLLLTSFGWLLASLAHVQVVEQLSLVVLLCLLVVSLVGYRAARTLMFPLALLIFALPVWEPLRPHMQLLSAHGATVVVNSTGIPAVLEGTKILVPAGTFDVTPFCAGMRYLIVGTLAAVLFASTNRLGLKTTIGLVAVAVGLGLLVNVLRIATVVVLGELSQMQHDLIDDHSMLGWVLFGSSIFAFLLIAGRLIDAGGPAPRPVSSQFDGASVPANSTVRSARTILLSLAALMLGPALAHAYQPDPVAGRWLAPSFPGQIGGWRAAPAPAGGYRPVFDSPDAEYFKIYRDPQGSQVYLYVAEYARQERGREAVSNGNRAYDTETWTPILTRKQKLVRGSVRETRIQSESGAEKLIWQWYYVHGFGVSSSCLAKLLNAWGTLSHDPAIAAVIIAADIKHGGDDTAALLSRFVAEAKPAIESALDRVRGNHA